MSVCRLVVPAIALAISLVVGACSGSSAPGSFAATADVTAVPLPVPRFDAGSARLETLVGTTFVGDLPDALAEAASTSRSAGAAIVNAESGPADADTTAMHWVVDADGGDFLVTTMADREPDGTPVWRVRSTWHLVLAPDMVLTFGTNVCAAPAGSFDGRNGDFLAVTNQEQSRALGAWTMTIDGPVDYPDVAGLDCERFTP